MNWHTITTEETLIQTASKAEGLTDAQAKQKLQEHGKNELQAKKQVSALIILLRQFFNVMILVLVGAAIISALVSDITDTIIIVVIIILNAIIGFIQEYRAEKTMEALQKSTALSSTVLRNNSETVIPSAEVVPGDIVVIKAGDIVPADIRLLQSESLKINEASLTGESNAVDKITDPLKEENIPLGDRQNMGFKGTNIVNGRGKGIVIATGMQTELGKIAKMLETAHSVTPLQKRLTVFSRKLTVIIIFLCGAFFLTGYLQGKEMTNLLLVSVSLAVAAIPEALPAVVTIALALGARRLMKQRVVIRKLYAVETLGSVTYICTDKTGTLTKNEMHVQKVWVADETKQQMLMEAMSLNHDVNKNGDGTYTGDPTEVAMVVYAKTQKHYNRIKEIPFDSERKAMTTIHEKDGKFWVITKGASEIILTLSNDKNIDQHIKAQQEEMAQSGMRVIGFAGKEIQELPNEISPETIEKDLVFIGFAGLIDPPREEAKQAITECKTAGIATVMITGDHPATAGFIAKEIGIIDNAAQKVITGTEMEAKSDEAFKEEVEQIRVYARVSPQQKLKIVEMLQQKEQFVSMTGDGVNDAPSLKKANIGIAMGITGTDVTKEAAHMILLDDNFATIVKAVEEGRRIYANIRKFIKYILTGNAAEIWTIFLAPLIGLPISLLPIHILWINLVTDGLPALALAAEPAETHNMKQAPRKPNESIFAQGLGIHVLWVGLFIGLLTIATQWFEIANNNSNWQTIVFTILCFSQLWHVIAIRSELDSVFKIGFFSNKPLLFSVIITVLLQVCIIYIPALNVFFHTKPLTAVEFFTAFAVSSVVFVVVEIEKWIKRKRKAKAGK
ncbi:MAG: cation-translocating P-type ATPase [Bacteroidota bacterium]